jgi:hypothetical protein
MTRSPRFTEGDARIRRHADAPTATEVALSRLPLALIALAWVQCAIAELPHAGRGAPTDGDASLEDARAGELADASSADTPIPQDGTVPAPDASPAGPLPCAALPLCDGFESAAPGGPPSAALWSIAQPDCTGSGTLAVDDAQAHSGQHSVKVNGGAGYCDHIFIANASVIATLGPQVYTRVFVRLGAPLGAGHVTFLAMKDSADKGGDVRMGGQDMILMYNRQSDDATLPVLSPTGTGESVALAANAWTCIESHFDETAGTIDTWVDGKEIAGLVENGTPTADVSTQWLSQAWNPTLADFRIGWESYSGQTMTLWFDDVALAAQRIGCGS